MSKGCWASATASLSSVSHQKIERLTQRAVAGTRGSRATQIRGVRPRDNPPSLFVVVIIRSTGFATRKMHSEGPVPCPEPGVGPFSQGQVGASRQAGERDCSQLQQPSPSSRGACAAWEGEPGWSTHSQGRTAGDPGSPAFAGWENRGPTKSALAALGRSSDAWAEDALWGLKAEALPPSENLMFCVLG